MQLVALGRAPPLPSRKSLHGLDWFVFFLADAQVGFGPLIAVYLTAQKWTQADIGLVLTIGGPRSASRADAGRRFGRRRALRARGGRVRDSACRERVHVRSLAAL